MNTISMRAAPAFRNDIRCALTVAICSIASIVTGYNTTLFNVGLIYGVLSWFLARFFYLRLVEKKSAIADIYPMIVGVLLPVLSIGMLLLARGGEPNFCFGMFMSIALYNGLYLSMRKKPQ